MRDNVIEGLFAMFTSADRAEAMAGDLMEERETRGWSWFWLHVVRVALTLWRNGTTEAPLRALALTMVGCGLFVAPAIGSAASIRLVPHAGPINWIAFSLCLWGGALAIGVALVTIAPRRGMAACATLALAGEALLMAFGVGVLWQDVQAESVLIYAIGLATAAPLLLGGAIARRRMMA